MLGADGNSGQYLSAPRYSTPRQPRKADQRFHRVERLIFQMRFPAIFTGLMVLGVTLAQSPQPKAFEAASIKPMELGGVMMGFSSSGSRVRLEGYTQFYLIAEAFHLKFYQILRNSALQDDNKYYFITAKAEGEAIRTRDEFREMLQTLLADRFRLKFHRETREIPVYALVVANGGPKFKESAPDTPRKANHGVNGRYQNMDFTQATMEELAEGIGVDRPVINETGLTGKYDFKVEATPEFRIANNPDPSDITIFDALQRTLGLKLEARKAPVEMFIVDHIEKPTEN
jgi:uncharacterized protein (TIGR03435 family)